MNTITHWEGQAEDTTLEYGIIAESEGRGGLIYPDTSIEAPVWEYDKPDNIDHTLAVASGILTGFMDVFWVGEFSLAKVQEWGRINVGNFVIQIAKLRGCNSCDLEQSIKFLEKDAPIPSDALAGTWGGGLQHHFRDFAHHASLVGLIFSILTQFTEKSYGTNVEGLFEVHDLPNRELIGNSFGEKLFNGVVVWGLHLVSDMAGSSSSPGKGTGIPGPILSLAKELSVLPYVRDLEVPYKGETINISVMLSKIFNGTAFEHASQKDLKRFDLRTELGSEAFLIKQGIPVVLNKCLIRAFYFIRRLCLEIRDKKVEGICDLKRLNREHFMSFDNKCIRRMSTVSSGVFCAIDLSDVAIKAYSFSIEDDFRLTKSILMRTNFSGIASFVTSFKKDLVGASEKKEKLSLKDDCDNSELINNQEYCSLNLSTDVDMVKYEESSPQ